MDRQEDKEDKDCFDVAIVGGGMAGLMCARELLLLLQNDVKDNDKISKKKIRVTLVEAENRLGGRISGNEDFLGDGHVLDLGAEFVHGTDTLLTDLIDEYRRKGCWDHLNDGTEQEGEEEDHFYEAHFITAHADGGPDEHPTSTGKFGMYYMDQTLKMYNDPSLKRLNMALEEIFDPDIDFNTVSSPLSVQAALDQYIKDTSSSPWTEAEQLLAKASFGNTAGCSDMNQISLRMMIGFEAYWDEHETSGDFRLPTRVGMQGIVNVLSKELQACPGFTAHLQWPVQRIRQEIQKSKNVLCLQSETGDVLYADACVVTLPPPALQALDMELTQEKKQALSYVGYERIVKVHLKLSRRLWPEHLQSIICGDDLPIPEIWFSDYDETTASTPFQSVHVVSGFLVSGYADRFIQRIVQEGENRSKEKAAQIMIRQMAQVLGVPEADFKETHLDTSLFDWKEQSRSRGGYMFPRIGMTPQHLQDLAKPLGDNIFFAGEATHMEACCTVQAAMATGVRAAKQVLQALS